MKVINYVIAEVDKEYLNEVETSIGNFIVNSTIESVENINRKVKVLAAPDFTILKEGDEIIIHHNILRSRNGIGGRVIDSNYLIGDKRYIVPLTEIFMYKRDGDWISIDPYCFIRPVEQELDEEGFNLSLSESSYKGKIKNVGIIEYPNKALLEQGVKKGDKVVFSKNSEYEFTIDGVLYYKMSTKDVLAVL